MEVRDVSHGGVASAGGAEAGPEVVQLEHAAVALDGRTVLKDVSFTVHAGELIVVLGPNGAGKTTLLKLLLGLLRPNAGVVRVMGRAPRRGNSAVGYTPQHRELEAGPTLRARDIVGFGLDGNRWGIGWPNAQRRAAVDRALAEVDALPFADAPMARLSGGEQQRLLIAQALLTNPRLLLLDEPLANLDLAHQQDIVNLVARVCRSRQIAVLLVTHDINPLLPVVDRVLYLANGHARWVRQTR